MEGRLKTRKWADKDGTEKYTTEIIGQEMTMLGSRDADEGGPKSAAPASSRAAPTQPRVPRAAAPASGTGFDDMDDDIPFACSHMGWDMESRLDRRIRRMHRNG